MSWPPALLHALDTILTQRDKYIAHIEAFLAPYPQHYDHMADIIAGEMGNHLKKRIAVVPETLSDPICPVR